MFRVAGCWVLVAGFESLGFGIGNLRLKGSVQVAGLLGEDCLLKTMQDAQKHWAQSTGRKARKLKALGAKLKAQNCMLITVCSC